MGWLFGRSVMPLTERKKAPDLTPKPGFPSLDLLEIHWLETRKLKSHPPWWCQVVKADVSLEFRPTVLQPCSVNRLSSDSKWTTHPLTRGFLCNLKYYSGQFYVNTNSNNATECILFSVLWILGSSVSEVHDSGSYQTAIFIVTGENY